jgi:hypothetical protein
MVEQFLSSKENLFHVYKHLDQVCFLYRFTLQSNFLLISGDIVAIYQQGQSIDEQESLAHGLIFRLTTNTIHVTMEDNDEEKFNSFGDNSHFMIVKMANDVTYRRLKQYAEFFFSKRESI